MTAAEIRRRIEAYAMGGGDAPEFGESDIDRALSVALSVCRSAVRRADEAFDRLAAIDEASAAAEAGKGVK